MYSVYVWAARFTVFILVLAGLQGCYAGATAVAHEVAVIKKARVKNDFVKALDTGYVQYQEDLAASGCPANEYALSPEIVAYVRSRPPYGLDSAIDLLQGIYRDSTQSSQVRSHALYHIAVAYMRRKESNDELAEEYLLKIQKEFPGTHDCVVNHMLREIRNRERFQQELGEEV